MHIRETAQLLATISAFDGRPVTDTAVESWHAVVADTPLEDAKARVAVFFSETRPRRILPSDVIAKRDPNAWMDQTKKPHWLEGESHE